MKEGCDGIWNRLGPIVMPTEEMWKSVAEKYKKNVAFPKLHRWH